MVEVLMAEALLYLPPLGILVVFVVMLFSWLALVRRLSVHLARATMVTALTIGPVL
jgi:hypothetical protein